MTVDSQHCHKQHPLVHVACLVDWLCTETIGKISSINKGNRTEWSLDCSQSPIFS